MTAAINTTRTIQKETNQNETYKLFDYVALTLSLMDIIYMTALYFTATTPWLSVGLAALFPLLNVPALKISKEITFPLVHLSLTLTTIPMFLVTYLSGPNSPGWLMCFSGVIACEVLIQDQKIKRVLIPLFVILSIFGSYLAGKDFRELAIITITLIAYSAVLTRIVSYIIFKNDDLNSEINERIKTQAKLTNAYEIISGSISYASRIQRAILPNKEIFTETFYDHFIYWEPRDGVGGDMYWCKRWGNGTVVALGDCTGHGVPGALVTMIGTGGFEHALNNVEEGKVAGFLQIMHQYLKMSLSQYDKEGPSDDGMEIGICYIPDEKDKVVFAGARFGLFVVSNGDVEEIKPTKKGIGYRSIPIEQQYEETTIFLDTEKSFYLTSDGLIDQVGGERKRGYGKKRFRSLLLEIQNQKMLFQRSLIKTSLEKYQHNELRRDDVSVIGFKI